MRNFSKYLPKSSNEDFQEAPIAPEVVDVVDTIVEPQAVEVVEAPVGEVSPLEVTPAPVDSFGGAEPIVEPVVDSIPAEAIPAPIGLPENVTEVEGVLEVAEPLAPAVVMDEISQVTVQREVIEQQADDLIETQHALEAYSDLLNQARGEISQQTAAFLNVGIKQVERVLGVSKISTGLESYNAGPRSDIMRANISLEDLKEYAGKAFEKLKELIKRLVESLLDAVNNLMTGITTLDNEVQKTEARVKAAKQFSTDDRKVTVRNPWALFANGKSRVHDTKALSGLAHFSAYAYPEAVKKYYEGIARIVSGFNVVSGDADDTVDRIFSASAPLDDLYTDREVLPGNYQVDIAADGIVYGIAPNNSAKAAPETAEFRLRHTFELKSDLKKISDIVKIIKKARDEHGKIKAGAETVIKAVEKLEKAAENKELDAASVAGAKKVAQAALEVIRKSNPRSAEIIKYLTRILRAYVAVINTECGIHEAQKAPTAE